MASRSMGKAIRGLWKFLDKKYSTATNLVNVTKDDATGIATVSMARPPVNALNRELLTELRENLQAIEKDGSRGVIFTSSVPHVFSAGLDIMEMCKTDMQPVREFWTELQRFWITLYGLRLPIAAAINGSSPAGGCLMATSCEYRVLVDGKYGIGLNETKLGLIAPRWFRDVYIDTIGYRQAELALMRGTLFSPQEALQIGLVDEIVADQNAAISQCKKYIESYAKIPAGPRAMTKLDLRKERLEWLKKNSEADVAYFINFVSQPKTQAALNAYVQALKSKSK